MASNTLLIGVFIVFLLKLISATELSVCFDSGAVYRGKLSMGKWKYIYTQTIGFRSVIKFIANRAFVVFI